MKLEEIVIETSLRTFYIEKSLLTSLRNNDGGDWTEEEVVDIIKFFGNAYDGRSTDGYYLHHAGRCVLNKSCDFYLEDIVSLKELKRVIEK